METLVKNSATAAAMYDAFLKGDLPTLLANLSPDIKWVIMGKPAVPFAGTSNGIAEVTEFFKRLASIFTFTVFRVEHIVDASENYVIATGYYEFVANSTGKAGQSIWAMTMEFDEQGKVKELHDIYDTQTAVNILNN